MPVDLVWIVLPAAIGLSFIGWKYGGEKNREARFLLPLILWFPVLLVGNWVYDEIKGPDCDAQCMAGVQRFIEDNPFPTSEPFDPDKFIQDTLNGP